jgi:LPXTG-site transpeptidase (sortase) family protein
MSLSRTKSTLSRVFIVFGILVIAGIILRSTNLLAFIRTPVDNNVPIVVPTGMTIVNPPKSSTATSVTETAVGPRLSIPAIGVNAPIDSVGIAADGTMDVPYHLANVGWYQFGTKIGDVGSAVLAGHVDNRLALPAVFAHLKNLKVGDDIYIKDASGTKLHFTVTDVSDYSVTTAPVEAIFHDTSGQRLIKLITCERTPTPAGAFENSYDNRIVVTAKLVS